MSDFSFRFWIIENSSRVSENYYRFIPQEPSPKGGFLVPGPHNRIDTSMTVSSLLDEMLKQNGGYLLIVCHGSPNHVSIPAFKGTKQTLDEDLMDLVARMLPVAKDIRKIQAMPENDGNTRISKIRAIEEFFSKAGRRERFSDIESANASFNDFVKQASLDFSRKKDEASIQAMIDFVDKVERVQKIKYKRIELRACRVGSNPTLMKKLRSFFNCDTLIAPKFRVMRAVQTNALPAQPQPVLSGYKTRFTPDRTRSFCRDCGVSRSNFTAHKLSSVLVADAKKDGLVDHPVGEKATRRFSTPAGFGFDLTIKIVSEVPSAFDFTITKFKSNSTDPNFNLLDLFEVFHRQFVYEDAIIAIRTVVIGGMWLGNPGGFVLAGEPGYLENLIVVNR